MYSVSFKKYLKYLLLNLIDLKGKEKHTYTLKIELL